MSQPHVAFVNGGILGLVAFDHFLGEYLPRETAITGERIVLTSDLTVPERVFRRVLCQRLWRDGWLGIANPDLARFRYELNAGLVARRRLAARRPRAFDVIHFHRQATAYGSLDLMSRVPSIVSIDTTQASVIEPAASRLERASYAPNVRVDGAIFRRAAALISASAWAADSLRRMYPDCRTPINVLPPPVLLDRFDAGWIERRRARARDGALPRVLFMGGDFPRKGGHDLLTAWRDGGFGSRATLEIVTDWRIDGRLPPGVIQTSGVARLSAAWTCVWAEADLFVMPTRNEAFGIVFQEAAAAGLPAIGTLHHAIPEVVHEGRTGLLVAPGDVRALAAALDALISSPDLRHQMGTHARAVIEDEASPARYLAALTGIILDVSRTRRLEETAHE